MQPSILFSMTLEGPGSAEIMVGLPDYFVQDIRYDSDGNGWGYKAVIKNNGSGSVLGSTVQWYINGVDAGQTSIGGIGAGDSLGTMIPFEPGDSIRVVCDYNDDIDESDENNNERSEDLERPDLIVSDIRWTPEVPLVGETVTFYAQVENIDHHMRN